MATRFDDLKTTLLKSISIFVLMIVTACASQQTRETSIDESIESLKQVESALEDNKDSELVDQDMGTLSLHERNEKEALNNLQNELNDDQQRIPAQEEENNNVEQATQQTTEPAEALTVVEEIKIEDHNKELADSAWKVPENEKLSNDELNKQLFDAKPIIVQKGDSLSKLAHKHLGAHKAWKNIWALNPNVLNPNIIEVGEKLYLPKEAQIINNAERTLASTQEQRKETKVSKNLEKKAPVKAKGPLKVTLGPSLSKAQDKAPLIQPEADKNKANEPLSQAAPTAPVIPENLDSQTIENAFTANNSGESHSTEELLSEKLDIKNRKAGKESKHLAAKVERKVSNTEDDSAATQANKGPSALSRIINGLGVLILLAVIASFFMTKPTKNQ